MSLASETDSYAPDLRNRAESNVTTVSSPVDAAGLFFAVAFAARNRMISAFTRSN